MPGFVTTASLVSIHLIEACLCAQITGASGDYLPSFMKLHGISIFNPYLMLRTVWAKPLADITLHYQRCPICFLYLSTTMCVIFLLLEHKNQLTEGKKRITF